MNFTLTESGAIGSTEYNSINTNCNNVLKQCPKGQHNVFELKANIFIPQYSDFRNGRNWRGNASRKRDEEASALPWVSECASDSHEFHHDPV